MYINQLLDAYKDAKRYVQDKQIAHDLGISTQKLSNIRNGSRYLTETEALFIADEIGADKETVLVYLAADKAKSYEAQQAWANIAKKYNGLGLRGISMVCIGLGLFTECANAGLSELHRCALCILC
ncbi:TPA: hypothetical protein I7704_13425 [Vibrio vulnificus]|nr:DUF3693 domain-containing protein [Vibrio vulnificus]HAS8194971.1 hypothetical protein [Vibrio vulnificus]HAS8365447.1 hypothetical protein [Vibrio vulnificus]